MKIYKEKKNRYSKLRVNGLGNYMDRPLMLFFAVFSDFLKIGIARTGDIFRLICIVDISKTKDPSFHFVSKMVLVVHNVYKVTQL